MPPELWAVVAKMLAKNSVDRYQTPGDVEAALIPFLKPGAVPAGLPATAPRPVSLPVTPLDASVLDYPPPFALNDFAVPAPDPRPARRPTGSRWRLPAAALAVIAVAAVGAAAFLGQKVSVKTPEGTLVVEVNEPGAELTVDGRVVTLTANGQRYEARVKPGTHTVEIKNGKLTSSGEKKTTVTVDGDKVVTVTAELLPKAAPPATPEKAPTPPVKESPMPPAETPPAETPSAKERQPLPAETPSAEAQKPRGDTPPKAAPKERLAEVVRDEHWSIDKEILVLNRNKQMPYTGKGNGMSRVLFGDKTWRDLDFEYSAMKVEGEDDWHGGRFSVVYEGKDTMNYRQYLIGKEWTNALTHSLYHIVDGTVEKDSTHIGNVNIVKSRWYKAKISIRGKSVVGYLDGAQTVTQSLPAPIEGKVGISSTHGQAVVHFKDIKVTLPSGKVVWKGLPELP